MNGILDMITSQLDAGKINQIGRRIGANEAQAGTAVQAALPVILGQLTRNAQSPTQAGGLINALDRDHDGSILDDLGGFLGGTVSDRDERMVGHMFGNRQTAVQQQLGKAAGLDAGSMGKLLATLGPMVMGALGKARRQQSSGGNLGELLGQERHRAEASGTGFGLVDKLLDADGDGDVDMSDLISRGGGLLSGLFKR